MTNDEIKYVLTDAKEALELAVGSRREDAARRYCAQIADAAKALRAIVGVAADDYRIERIEAASLALTGAIELFAKTKPNGRDYSAKDLNEAEARWEEGMQALQRTRSNLWVGVEC